MEASNGLVNFRMLPIQDIPQLPKMAQEVLGVAGLILEPLQEGMPLAPVPRTELRLATISVAPGTSCLSFFLFWDSCNTHTHRYIYILENVCPYILIFQGS
jgi:hypothetical protein